MRSAVLAALAVAAAHVRGYPRDSQPSCKAVPTGADWPSLETWTKLNETTGGRLLKPAPPGAVCHPSNAAYSADKCSAVQTGWLDEFFHADDPVSVEWNNWNNDSCIPDPRLTCSGSGYPVYVINATTPQHVKAGVDFGWSLSAGGLARWPSGLTAATTSQEA